MAGFFKRVIYPQNGEGSQYPPRKEADPALSPQSMDDIDEKKASPLAVIYQSELDYISRCILDYPNIETGGDLFGFWTNEGVPVVLYAIGPGRNANHQDTFFVQDVPYFVQIASALNARYQLSHMGEWHSHHQLGLAHPSGHDARTIFKGIRQVPLRHMLLCIGNYRDGKTTINPFSFHENDMEHYLEAYWRVLPIESPFRPLIDRDLADILLHPQTQFPSHGPLRVYGSANKQADGPNESSRLKPDHWLRRPGGVDLLRKMIALLQEQCPEESVSPQWDEAGNIFLALESCTIQFPDAFPAAAPQLSVNNVPVSEPLPWQEAAQDIPEAFGQWLQEAQKYMNP